MKIHIFGASGSGVTTLGKALSEELNLEYFDSDDFF
ncbi:shikimate kinase [Chryseobacterium viscerum]|nr:shikimate kinase [Chryseobacterium viscerum]